MSVIIRKEIENKQKTIIITLHKCPTSLLLRLCFLEKKICRNTRGTERAGEHKQTGMEQALYTEQSKATGSST